MAALRATQNNIERERSYTAAEFETMPELEEGYQLIKGKLVKKVAAGFQHMDIADRLRIAYFKFDPEEKIGVMRLEVLTRRGEEVPAPDVAFWIDTRRPARTTRIAVRPDFVAEIAVTTKIAEETERAKEYIKAGVRLVWVLQASIGIAAVFRPGQDEPEVIGPNGVLDGEGVIPGFRVKLADLF